MAIDNDIFEAEQPARLPLIESHASQRVLAWRDGVAVSAAAFLADVQRVAATLPQATAAVNLCEDRYAFLVAFCALIVRGQINLLPPSRARQAIDEVMVAHPGSYAVGEQSLEAPPPSYHRLPQLLAENGSADSPFWPQIPAAQIAAIGYTSGSTGKPGANLKTWRAFHASNAGNYRMLQAQVGEAFNVVATVPPQHMYGIETTVMLPLLGEVAVHAGRPFFPSDIAAALAAVPAPRVLVTTPVHLRALVASGAVLPPIAAMLSATAPMPTELAQQAEQRFAAPLLEVFGSTETCVFASRRTVTDAQWTLYEGARLHPQPDGTLVQAPQLDEDVVLPDIVSLHDEGRCFELRGRHADMLEIAGKRASLADLTRRLLAVPGVRDGVVLQLDEPDAMGVRRIAAVAVAPGLDETVILDALRLAIDPLFLPRRLRLVQALPRNETGKLPRAALLELLASAR